MASGKHGGGRQNSPSCALIPHTRIEDETRLSEYYDIGEKLGEGTFGIVKAVVHKETGEKWACKAVNKEKAGTPAIKLLEREVAILKRVQHDHIITLKEVFETPKKMYLVMEYCGGGELSDALKKKKKFNEAQAKIIVRRLAQAISYLHRNDMVHRDLKLENILLSTNPHDQSDDLYIKVTDFGLSVVKGGVGIENLLMDFCGTPMYMAPEIIDNKQYGEKCDVWAMGVICFTLLVGVPPFASTDEEKLYDLIKKLDIKAAMGQDAKWATKSPEVKDLIAKMLNKDTAHRFTSHEVLDHPWITGQPLASMRQENVLDMMRKWRTEQEFRSSDIPVEASEGEKVEANGETSSPATEGSSRGSSASKESPKLDRKSVAATKKSQSHAKAVGSTAHKSSSRLPNSTAPSQNSTHRHVPSTHHAPSHTNSRYPAAAKSHHNGGLRATSDSNVRLKRK